MKGIYWRTLTFKKSVIYLIKVNYTSYNYTPNIRWNFRDIFCNVYPMCASITTPLLLLLYDGWPSQYRHGSRNNTAEAI